MSENTPIASAAPVPAVGRVSAKRVTQQEPQVVVDGAASTYQSVGLRCANPTYEARRFQGELPSPEQIAERLAGWALESDGFEGEGV